MDTIEVIVVADKDDRFCRSCESGRTMKEITGSLSKQLHRRFGDGVTCRFVDIRKTEAAGIDALVSSDPHMSKSRLPLILINGQVRFRGIFSPTLIQREINMLLSRRKDTPEPEAKKPMLSQEQLRQVYLRQMLLASQTEGTIHRLSFFPGGGNKTH